MSRIRGAQVPFLLLVAACGGGRDPKEPNPDQTAHGDAATGAMDGDAASDASAASAQTDAGAVAAADAGSTDDVDKSVSVCGDEAIPIEKRVRKKVKECWSAAATRNPAIDGHVRVTFTIDGTGKITKTDIVQAKTLGPATTACITTAINTYKLDGTKCASKTVGFEMAFGRAAHE